MKADTTAEMDAMRAARIELRIEEGLPVRKSSRAWYEEYKQTKAAKKWRKFMPQPPEEKPPVAFDGDSVSSQQASPVGQTDTEIPEPPPAPSSPPPPIDVNQSAPEAGPQPPKEEPRDPVQIQLAAAYCGWLVHRGELYERSHGLEGTPMPPREVIEKMIFPAAQRLEAKAAEWMGMSKLDSTYVDLAVAGTPGAWVVVFSAFKAIEKKRAEKKQPPQRPQPPTNGQTAATEPTPPPAAPTGHMRRLNPNVLE